MVKEEEEEEEEEGQERKDHNKPANGADSMEVSSVMDDQHERSATENSQAAVGGFNHVATLSEADMQDQMDQFTYIMHQKFLLGEDNEHLDYSKIDNDETLDDHWLREANDDAEEKYFDQD